MSAAEGALFEIPAAPPATGFARCPVVWSYGMGVESTAGVVRMLLDPTFRPRQLRGDLSNLLVMTAQTGDEWSSLCDLVARHVLPLLRQFAVRTVEVARAGPRRDDGIVVLQDTRQPYRMHPDPAESGFYALSEEDRRNGVMPTLSSRRCSEKAKGWPQDTWRARELGDQPYLHAIGYNRDELARIHRDSSITLGGRRTPIYPLHAAGWTRQQCSDYLYDLFGVRWPKSCCRQCCFVSKQGWPGQLDRYRAAPHEAYRHVVDEYVTLALNANAPLFGRAGSLTDRLTRDDATAVLALAHQHIAATEWALYCVRRIYFARATAWRSIQVARRGSRDDMSRLLTDLAAALRIDPVTDDTHTRLWLARHDRDTGRYPQCEQFFVAAPGTVSPKQRTHFEHQWATRTPDALHDADLTAHSFLGTSPPHHTGLRAA